MANEPSTNQGRGQPSCSATTRDGAACPIHADRERQGRLFCHVHDPEGLYQRTHGQGRRALPPGITEEEEKLIGLALQASRSYRASCKATGTERDRRLELVLIIRAIRAGLGGVGGASLSHYDATAASKQNPPAP